MNTDYIGIDGNEANVSQPVGSNIFAARLIESIVKHSVLPVKVYLKSLPKPHMPQEDVQLQYRIIGPERPAWTQWRLPLELYSSKPRPRVFFSPGHYAPRFCPVPSVVTILDLAFLKYPETFKKKTLRQLIDWTSYSIKQAASVVTISQSTKTDVVNYYHLDPEKVSVCYPGSNLEYAKSHCLSVNPGLDLPEKYIVFVGTLQPRKNLKRLLTVFDKLILKHRDLHLVLVGKAWHQFNQVKLGDHRNVKLLGYLTNQELIEVLTKSQGLVMPSLYEGFGLPVLEAMQLGVLVAVSDTSSLPEITGDWPFLFNPKNSREMYIALNQMISIDNSNKKKLVRIGKIRAKRFSWDNCAKDILEVLKNVAANR